MQILIHAVPERMWYVDEFLIPAIKAQAPVNVMVWNDAMHRGNLAACMDAFASMPTNEGTWHIQDDVLPCRDFVQRCSMTDFGVAYGFCCEYFLDDPGQVGFVYPEDAWHSFQCVRIPDAYARACAEWFSTGEWRKLQDPELEALYETNRGDDTFFRTWLRETHPAEAVYNIRPCLVEHVDLFIGGSVLHQWRDYQARAHWFDEDLVSELRQRLRERKQ